MRYLALLSLVFVVACFDPEDVASCTITCTSDSDCISGQTCNTASGKCTAGEDCSNPQMCTPGEFVACVNGAVRTCNAAGSGTEDAPCGAPGCNTPAQRCNACIPDEVSCTTNMRDVQACMSDGSAVTTVETCAANCVAAAGPAPAHCRYLEPKWLPDICDMPAMMDLFMPNASAAFSSDLDTNCTGGVILQPPGRPICVVRAKTITIPNLVTLTISGQRPIAFVADTALNLNGTLDAGATGSMNGAGGGIQTTGAAATSNAGGGGAGFGTVGANGGATGTGNGGVGGAVLDPLTLAFFAGGPRAGGGSLIGQTSGGGGGGAILLAACRGTVTTGTTSTIDVGGGGGEAQYDQILGGQIAQSTAGAGGGAGGYVAIEGLTGVVINGALYANGGGGGGGNTANDIGGTAGGNGQRSTTVQATGGAGGGAGALGGRGGIRGTPPTAGGGTTSSAGAGGGGAVGVFHIFTPMGVTPMLNTTSTSPNPIARTTPTR
jgi:hypothetical protein